MAVQRVAADGGVGRADSLKSTVYSQLQKLKNQRRGAEGREQIRTEEKTQTQRRRVWYTEARTKLAVQLRGLWLQK